MTNGDALLTYLNARGTGSWLTFRDAVGRIKGDAYSRTHLVARALCARGLVEFDWDGDRSWSVPPTSIMRLPERPGCGWRFMAVGLLDDSQVQWLVERGIDVETRSCHIIDGISYSRSLVDGTVDAVLTSLPDDSIPPFYFDFVERTDSIAERIIDAHPTLDQLLRTSPIVDPREIINADVLESYDAALHEFVEVGDLDLSYDYACLMAQWRYDRRRYFSVNGGTCRAVDRDIAICASIRTTGRRFFEIDGDAAMVPSDLALPMLLERALFLAGASIAFDGANRLYEGVSNPLLRQISYRLGIAPRTEPRS